jgi:hypothetical protein
MHNSFTAGDGNVHALLEDELPQDLLFSVLLWEVFAGQCWHKRVSVPASIGFLWKPPQKLIGWCEAQRSVWSSAQSKNAGLLQQQAMATVAASAIPQGEGTQRKLAIATQPEFPRIVISLSWTHVTEWSRANWGNGNATSRKTEKLNCMTTEHVSLLTVALPRGSLVSAVLRITHFSDSFVSSDGTKDWRTCKFCFCIVNWARASYIWQTPPRLC